MSTLEKFRDSRDLDKKFGRICPKMVETLYVKSIDAPIGYKSEH